MSPLSGGTTPELTVLFFLRQEVFFRSVMLGFSTIFGIGMVGVKVGKTAAKENS